MNSIKLKFFVAVGVLLGLSQNSLAQTRIDSSGPQESAASVARVVKVVTLLDKQGNDGKNLLVNAVLVDKGGSTDVSPTQTVFLTMYSKGEMFSTEASFKIADIYSFVSARRVQAGIYQIVAKAFDDNYNLKTMTFTIDGKKASMDIQNVDCGAEFDCEASTNFKSAVVVNIK